MLSSISTSDVYQQYIFHESKQTHTKALGPRRRISASNLQAALHVHGLQPPPPVSDPGQCSLPDIVAKEAGDGLEGGCREIKRPRRPGRDLVLCGPKWSLVPSPQQFVRMGGLKGFVAS